MKQISTASGTVPEAVARLTAALQARKFGVLHVHDLRQTLNSKGVPFAPECRVLEVCNPQQAAKVLTDDIDGTRDFYCNALGMRVGPRPPLKFAGYWLYVGDTPCIHIGEWKSYVAHSTDVGIPVTRPAAGTGPLDHIAFNAVENYIIAPKVYGRELELSNLAVLVAVAIGGQLGGVMGALLALPIAATYPIVERNWLRPHLASDTIERHSRLSA